MSQAGRTGGRGSTSSRSNAILFGLVGLLFGIVALVIAEPWRDDAPTATERIGATLELAAGEVVLVPEVGEPARLGSGTPLPPDARLETGPGARALVRLGDGSSVFVRDGARVRVDAGVIVERGEVWLEAPAADRGTEPTLHRVGGATVTVSDAGASLAVHDGAAEIYVAEGSAVVASAGGRREVAAGERARVSGEEAPTLEPVAFWDDWTGGMADRTSSGELAGAGGALYAVDRAAPAGAAALPLTIARQNVKVVLRDSIAETEVDQRFFNPSAREVEGWYWLTIPDGAQLVSFALETDGVLVEGEVVERRLAAQTYERAIERRNDPALLEWIDARTARARIYPVPAAGERRVVVRWQQLLTETEGKLRYVYPMAGPRGRGSPTIEELSIDVALEGELSVRYTLATLAQARIEEDGRRVTMRRSGFTPRRDFELELTRREGASPAPARVAELDPGSDQARFVMVRWIPELDFSAVAAPRGDVVVVVDTSAGGDAAEHHTKLAVAEALLRSLSEGDRFAVMSADLTAEVLHPESGLTDATPTAIDQALERLDAHRRGGATDLGAMFETALARVHELEQPAVVYVGDGQATSGEHDADAVVERLRRAMTGSRARLFTVGVGTDLDEVTLARLARVGGGDHLRVDAPEQAVPRALELASALKSPTITELSVDLGEGLDDVSYNFAGKLSRGHELVVLARSHHDLPAEIVVRGRLAGESFEASHRLVEDDEIVARIVPRLWAAAQVERLLSDGRGPDAARGAVLSLGLEWGLLTPFTSFLALDSEQAYVRQGIQRRPHPFDVRLVGDARRLREPLADVAQAILAAAVAPLGCGAAAPAPEAAVQTPPPPPPAVTPPAATPGDASTMEAKNEVAAADAAEPLEESIADAPARAEPAPAAPTVLDASGREGGRTGSGGGKGYRDEDGRDPSPVADPEQAQEAPGDEAPARLPHSGVPRHRKLPCTDASARPLVHRRTLWEQRLARVTDMTGALAVFEASAGGCEIASWRDERVFLQLLQRRAATEHDILVLLGHFGDEPDARDYLARALLRRLVDPALVAAVENATFGSRVDWRAVDEAMLLEVGATQRLEILQKAIARAPEDPQGQRRLIQLLAEQGHLDEALARGRALRDAGAMSPGLAQQLGDLFVRHGRPDDAKRIYSEIVEFDPSGPASRQLLGDVFLRHGWFEEAYRQYDTLVGLSTDQPAAAMRLARAAAGAERVDEALRILRKVAAGEGRPGTDDPRRFARLLAAFYLGHLLAEPDAATPTAGVEGELKRLQLFDGPSTWTLLAWQDLQARLVLSPVAPNSEKPDEPPPPLPDALDAGDVGLFAVQHTGPSPELFVRHRGPALERPVPWIRLDLRFDGTGFAVAVTRG